MRAAGIDLGGSKIEAQIFDAEWNVVSQRRVVTPTDYSALLTILCDQVKWLDETAGAAVPIGVGAAGRVSPMTGRVLAANLAAHSQTLPQDLTDRIGRPFVYMNDCNALALSEAVFGAGKGHSIVAALILGTGVGGGVSIDGNALSGHGGLGGEFGHTAAPANLVSKHKLPIAHCGCGRAGCIEAYLSGPGLTRLAAELTGLTLTPPEIAARKDSDMAEVWEVWCAFAADLAMKLALILDPQVIVLGGGLSQIDGVADDIAKALGKVAFDGFPVPEIRLAQGGDASGARGAAYAAWQAYGK